MSVRERVVLLVGGVGGAKLALGLAHVLPPQALTVVVNTADDMHHFGLHISPDVDTVMYTLAGMVNPETGWGLAGETFRAMESVARYGGPTWFNLGDRDLGTHLERTRLLAEGCRLTEATRRLCAANGVAASLLPMSDDRVRTILETDQGPLDFQTYFVRERWQPRVSAIRFEGSEDAEPSPEVAAALEQATLIVFGPSNPYLSIDPILSIPGIRQRITAARVRRIAVSPIIAGQAVKGPTAKLMREFGVEPTPEAVVEHYAEYLDGIILDGADHAYESSIRARGVRVTTTDTYMTTLSQKINLAHAMLNWIEDDLT